MRPRSQSSQTTCSDPGAVAKSKTPTHALQSAGARRGVPRSSDRLDSNKGDRRWCLKYVQDTNGKPIGEHEAQKRVLEVPRERDATDGCWSRCRDGRRERAKSERHIIPVDDLEIRQ